jgi:hypothetical protein
MSDLTNATRELFIRSVKHQVFYQIPVLEELARRHQVTFSGGKKIERLVISSEMDDLAQTYSANTALTDQKKQMLDKPSFYFKLMQVPLRYDVDEELQNVHAGREEQLLDLAQFLVKQGQRGARIKLEQMVFNSGSTTGVADTADDFQSLLSALDHDVTYGGLSRSWSGGTRDWWQGADPGALNASVSSSAQTTSYNLSISNLRKWIYETDVAHHMETPNDLYVIMCPTLYNKLRAEMEAKVQYQPSGDTQKQGFTKMYLDGSIQVVSSPYLQTSSTMQSWLFILNLSDWELRIHTQRNFKMTEFEWQGKQSNGYDFWLSRILLAGNLLCWKPNGSMYLQSVS